MHLRDTGQARQVLAVDAGEIIRILDHDFQQVIGGARHQVAFQHVGNAADAFFESVQNFIRLT